MPHLSRRFPSLRLALAALLVGACGGDSEPLSDEEMRRAIHGGTGEAPTIEMIAAPPPPELDEQDPPIGAGEEQVLIEKRGGVLEQWAKDNIARRDPGFDNWRTEVLHNAAKGELKHLLHAVFQGGGVQEIASAAVAAGFEGGTALRPAEFDEVFSDGATRVLRPRAAPERRFGADLLESELRGLGSAFRRGTENHVFFKIFRVDLDDEPGYFSTSALVHVDGAAVGPATGPAGRLQVNCEWRNRWRVLGDDTIVLLGIESVSYEEVHTESGLFDDISTSVFARVGAWEQELMHGVGDYQNRVDRLIGSSFIGAQGLAVGDVTGDGLDDVFVCQHGGVPNRLFRRRPDGQVADITGVAGVGFLENTRSALILDLDNDGDQDLVTTIGPNLLLLWNDGKGRFPEMTPVDGVGTEDIYSLTAADPDQDGDLDLYGCRYVLNGLIGGVPTPYHDADNGAANLYWRNDGPRKFTLATEAVGLDHNNRKFSLAAIWEDFDGDGDVDLYVANDFGRNNLYRNDGGHFRDVADEVGAEDLGAGMGVSVADYDLDGDVDLHVSNMFSSAGQRIVPQSSKFLGGEHADVHRHYERHARGNTLLSNNGDGTFTDVTDEAGIAVGGWAWGAKFVDFNNDGWDDVYSPNGFVTNSDPDDL